MQYLELPVNDIKLDLDNPRIKHWLEQFGDEVSSEQISLALSGGDSNGYRALYDSIVANKGIITPILVNHAADGTYTVVEGNTRVQIYKELADSTKDPRWEKIIAIVHEQLNEQEIHAIRLQSHLVGAREWMPFSKAKYLYFLSEEQGMPLPAIISMCGGKANGAKIRASIDAYKDFVTHYAAVCDKMDMEPAPQDFSKFVECQKTAVIDALLTNHFTKVDFAKWVVQGNVDNALNVRLLPRVLANKNAREEFLKSNLSEASGYLVQKNASTVSLASVSVYELAEELYRKLKVLPYAEFKSLKFDVEWADRRDLLEMLSGELESKIEDLNQE